MLLRRVLGDALRARRQAQRRTLREVSGAANVSLGYLSEIERGHKEPSSELLAAICAALNAQLWQVLREVSTTMESAQPATVEPVGKASDVLAERLPTPGVQVVDARRYGDGTATGDAVRVSVCHDGPLRTTLRTTRTDRRRPPARAA
jgi:transcriptional regulator with XRE-family HTH domain